MQNPHQHHHHLRHARPPHQQQNLHQQLVSLLSAASAVDSTPGPSAAHEGPANDAARVAALESLQRTIVFPPNSLLLLPSAPFLAQGLSPLFSDQSYGVSRAAVVAYGSLCGVLCSPLANQGQPYPAGGGLPDGFVAWALPLLRDTSNPPVAELALEGLRAMLSVGDPAGLDRFIHPIVRACQDVLEDERTSLALLRQLLGLLSLISAKFVHSFRPHFADIVDVLLGWAFVPDLSDSDRGLIMDTFFQFQGHWLSSLPFSLGLLSKFLGDMEVLGGPSSNSGARLLALLSCFSTLLGVMASAAVTDARLLDQMVGPLQQNITPRLLRCVSSMFGSDVVGRSKWMGESWQCVLLLAQILRERFAGFYEMAADIVSHCLAGAVPSFQLDAGLKSNMRILSLQGTALLPSSVKALLQFHRPISQLRLHPNNLIVARAVTTYIFFLQHGSDSVVSQAITCLLEELELLKELLEKVYARYKDVGALSFQTSKDNQSEMIYSEQELFSLINFDLKILVTSIYSGAAESQPDQIVINTFRYARATRLASFLLEKFTPLDMPLSGSPELQLNIFKTLRKLSEVELLSNSMVCKASQKGSVTDLASPREEGYSELRKIYLDRYGIFLATALDGSHPLALKVEALDWIHLVGRLFNLNGKLSGSCETCDGARFPSVLLFAVLDSAYDLETKVRYKAASSLEALLLSGLVDPSLYPATAQVALDKLGDPESSISEKFLKVVSIALPATVHTCGLLHNTAGSFSRKNLLVSMVHQHCMNWRHVLAVKQSTRKFQSQQLVTILSYIANRLKLPLSSWVQRTVFSCRARNDVLSSQLDATTDANASEELLQDAKMVSSMIDRICPVSNMAAIWWCIHEAARHCIHLRLRTNLGGPAQTFAAFERALLDVPNLLISDANKQSETNFIGSASEVSLLPMRLLLDFVESLKKNIYHAYEGSFLLPSPAKPSTVFFRANKKVCEEWFSRICDPMMNASLALHCKDATFHYCAIRLTDLRSTVLSSFKERTNEGISILRDNSRIGADVLKVLRHAALALCQSHEADALFGLQKWAEESFSSLFGSSVSPFAWISGLVHQAEGRYEMAAAYYSHLLQSEEALGSMDSDGIQFIVSRTIECYTSLSDWKCLENWLTELQTLRSVHAGKPYSGALTTAGKEMNAIQALARFDEEDYTAAWTYLDLTPKSSSELTLDSKIALERSEQMLIRSMLLDSSERGGSKEDAIEKARLMLHEALSVAPLDGITAEAAAYAAQLHCISAFKEVTISDGEHKPNHQAASVVGSVNQLFPMERMHQDCGMWMKVLRVYRFVQPTSLSTLHLSQKLLNLARKQGNFMLAHRMKHYLLNHSLMSSPAQGKQQELLDLTTQYESILLNYAEGNIGEALTQLWLFVSPDMLSGIGSLTSFGSCTTGADVKAKACLKLSAWLGRESSNNFSSGILSKISEDFNASCGLVPVTQKLLPGNLNCHAIFEEVTGTVAKTATRLCPTMGKTWLCYASWCFALARSSSSAPSPVLSACSLSPVLEPELSLASHNLTDEEVFKVKAIVQKIDTATVEPVSSLVMQVVSLIQCVAGAPGSEARDSGESLSSFLSSQLRILLCTATSSVEKDEMLGSVVDELVEIWWSLRQRRVSLFGHAANGYFQFLSYSSPKHDSTNEKENFSRGKAKSSTLRAVLNLLHIILNYGLELREALAAGLSTVPILPWQEIIPQLFARLSSHPEKVVRQQLERLLMMLGKLSPCSVVYPTLVDINSSEGNPTDELQHILDLLAKHYPKLVEDVRLLIDELGMITVLWEEQWLSTLQDLHSDVMRRINMLKEEAARIAANPTLSLAEKSKINTTKYSAMMAPVIVALERRLATTSREPRTPHEAWFRKEYGEQLASAISALKTPPSSTALGEVWRQFEAIAASLITHHRKSSVSMSAVAPNLARVSTSEIPMPGFEKQITTDTPSIVTVASFSEQVIVLSTKTKPKKLVLQGSDGQKYTYLLKGREDLRLDARIMQLLEAINSFLGSLRETRSRSLAIRYYSVTPISGRAGLIQWVENVSSIYSIYKSWQKRTQLAQAQLSSAGGGSGNTSNEVPVPPVPRPSDMFYGKIIPALKEKGIRRVISRRDWPHDVKRKVFLELMQVTPRQLLWQEMWCASEGFRSFNLKIKRFSGSVAAMSMVGHILGLGDRHLDNILIDLCTGDIVHIDYNICFDKGKRLKIPEIVPFRLTQIMEAALGLSGIEGMFRASCEAVMTALQRNKDVILMLLEVFVWEPLMEWTRGGNTEDEVVLVGEEKKGMDLAVSLSLFSSRLQEIRVPLQEHHDLLVSTLPAAESALKSFLDVFLQYEVRSATCSHAEKERSTLLQQESSAKSLLAEATVLSENSRASFELQSHELAQAKSVATDKAQELATWVDLHAQVLDSLRDGSIPTATPQVVDNVEALSLTSAVLVSGVPLSVVPEPTKSLCADLDKDVSILIAELHAGISNATNSLKKYTLLLRRVLPSNYITTSPISGWAQILQLSVNNLSADMLSLAKREASELLSKAQGERGLGFSLGGGLVQQRYLELINNIDSHIADMGRLDSECSELMSSIESNKETQSRERLFAATVKYVQSPGNTNNEEKRAKVLLVLGMAVRGIYMDVRSKVLDLSSKSFRVGGLIVGDSGGSPKIGYGTGFQDFQEQIERCVLVSGFVNQVEEAIGIKLSGPTSSEQWASIYQGILNATNHIIEKISEAAIPEIVRQFFWHKSEVMEVFASLSQIRGTVNSAIEKLVEVELERASVVELEQNYFAKAGLIKERQLALEEAAARGRDHLSWEEADELASQEESCRAQLEQLHLTWNQKDVHVVSLGNMETSLINSLVSSEQYLSSLLTTSTQEGGRSNFVLHLASLIEPFSELESLDLLLPSEFGGSMAFVPDVVSSGSSSEMTWALSGLLRNHTFFVWKVGLLCSILDLCLHEISSADRNIGLDQLYGSLKRKLMALLHEHAQQYLKGRVAPSLVLQLDKEVRNLHSMDTSDDGSRDHLGAVNRMVTMLEEYCDAHETARAAKSSIALMKRQVNYLTDALGKAVLEAVQLEWLHDISAPFAFKSKVLSQNIFGNDEAFSVILNMSRKKLLDEIQLSISSIVRSVEGLQGCERASLPVEGQLERAMGWACAGPSSTVPSEFHDHLSRRRRLLSAVGDQASGLVEICTSVIEFEASRDGLFLASGAGNSYAEKGRVWQQLMSTYLTQLDTAYHSFTCAEQEWKLAQHNMETATSTLLSVSSQLSMASAKAKSSLADIQETLGAMRGRAHEAVEALSAFSRVSKGHSALTSESGSLIEEVLAITEDLHDIYSLGKEASTAHSALMTDLSKANSILLPLEASLASDLADAFMHENESNNSLGNRSLFVHGKALYQSYNFRVKEACQTLAPLVPSLTLLVTHLHSLLIKLGRTSSVHAGNLHKALEGIGESQGARSEELSLSKSVVTLQEADSSAEREKEEVTTEESAVVCAETTALQDEYWISPPLDSYTSSNSSSPSDAAETVDIKSSQVQQDGSSLMTGASEVQNLDVVDKETNEAKPSETKNDDSLAEPQTSYSTDDQKPFSGSIRPMRGKNEFALSVLKQVEQKLQGRDVPGTRSMGISELVEHLVKQATSIDNLCNMYEGWTPWI